MLQLQISYLASLSMTIKDEAMAEAWTEFFRFRTGEDCLTFSPGKVFVNVVCAIFADLHDSRIRNLPRAFAC